MTNQQHPITPLPQLVRQWFKQAHESADPANQLSYYDFIATAATQWGADQELEACCAWLSDEALCESNTHKKLRAARRPKPPSLKEQALKELAWVGKHLDMPLHNHCNAIHTIHQALKQLND